MKHDWDMLPEVIETYPRVYRGERCKWLANSPGKMLVAGAVAVTLGDDARLPHRFSTPLGRHSRPALCERCPLSANHKGLVGPCGAQDSELPSGAQATLTLMRV